MLRALLIACGLSPVAWPLMAAAPMAAESSAVAVSQAEAELRSTHFFSEGRGLFALPPGRPTVGPTDRVSAEVFESFRNQTGVIVEGDAPVGYFRAEWRGTPVLAAGCAACHVGRAAGQTIVGLGNKSVDVGELGRLVAAGSSLAAVLPGGDAERELIERTLHLGRTMSDPLRTNETRGLVPTVLVFRWFYDRAGVPLPDDFPRGCTKVTHLWGYGEKQHVGVFVDGFADGDALGWSGLVDLASGQSFETFRSYRDRLGVLKASFAQLQPPAYPFAVDDVQAARGREVFARRCAECHGEYRRDAAGRAIFASPQFVPAHVVGTDDDRLQYRTPQFRALVDAASSDDFRYHDREPGYFAPRLEGVWARFPYLHNGSVPNLQALLTPPSARPHYWSLDDVGEERRFDRTAVGLTLPLPGSEDDRLLQRRAAAGSRGVYAVERRGHSNRGHPFGTDLSTDERRALIEYLKTL